MIRYKKRLMVGPPMPPPPHLIRVVVKQSTNVDILLLNGVKTSPQLVTFGDIMFITCHSQRLLRLFVRVCVYVRVCVW